jgi:hypothetical protein
MPEIRARVLVGPDRSISGAAPAAVPPGEHEVTINVTPATARQRRANRSTSKPTWSRPRALASRAGLRREGMYDEDGW